MKANNLDNCEEWVQPTILKLIKNYAKNFSAQENETVEKFIKGLKKLVGEGKLSIDQKIQFLIEFS